MLSVQNSPFSPHFINRDEPEAPATSPEVPLATCARGERAVTEMLNRPGMIDLADAFFDKKPGEAAPYYPYFTKQICANKGKLNSSPSEKDYELFAHQMFAIYRRQIVEEACCEANSDPGKWGFSDEEWKLKRPAFQDFIWSYAKSPRGGAASQAITDIMIQEFSLSETFWPDLDTVILPSEEEDRYLNS